MTIDYSPGLAESIEASRAYTPSSRRRQQLLDDFLDLLERSLNVAAAWKPSSDEHRLDNDDLLLTPVPTCAEDEDAFLSSV